MSEGPSRDPASAPAGAGRTFPRAILAGDTLTAARALLGALLVRDAGARGGRRTGRIVEVEAYIGTEDRASHARMGPTPRNRVMFGPPGVAYVYLVYGMHNCLNVVTGPESIAAALLIRAVEPVDGLGAMRAAREAARGIGRPVADARLTAGPALVCLAFGIDRSITGLDLCDPASPIRLETAGAGEQGPEVATAPRVGVAYAGDPWADLPWRFLVPGSPSLSRKA